MTQTKRHQVLGGILVRKECWTLSRSAKLFLVVACAVAMLATVRFIHPFLATTNRVQGEFLVVEGWVPTYALNEAVVLFNDGGYRKVLTSGCVVSDEWIPSDTYAAWGATRLKRIGMKSDLIQPIPCLVSHRDRTYNSALAVRKWLQDNDPAVKSIDVLTLGPHARRTRLLFQMALGNKITVGVIAVEDKDYDPAHWWRTSPGVRTVIGEGIAYFYAKFLFVFYSSESDPSE
jgi:hypothetical protein